MSQIVKLYPYQEKGKSMTYSAFRDSIDRVLLVLAMGLGKTTLCGEIIKDGYDKDKRILIVVHRDGLVRQFSDRIKKQFGVDNGLVLGSEKKEYRKPVQVASRQSLCRRLNDFPRDNFNLIIIDEAHYVATNEYSKILNHFEKYKLLGITATPFRRDGKPLKDSFDALVNPIKAKEAIQQGYLMQANYIGVGSVDFSTVKITKGDYDEKELYEKFKKYDIVEEVTRNMAKYPQKSMYFCINVAHTIEVYESLKRSGRRVAYVTGETEISDRIKIYEKFNSGEINDLVNCDILTEGADFPSAINCVLLKKTKSFARYLQMIGRVTRTCFGKTFCNVIDFCGNVEEHGFFEDYDNDLTLESGVKKKGFKKPVRCKACGQIKITKICSCGAEIVGYQEEEEKIKINGIELKVLSANAIRISRLIKLRWEKLKDHELRLYAKLKGLKQHWAYHTYADRHGIDKNMYNWQKIVFDKLKELEHKNNFTYEETKNVRS